MADSPPTEAPPPFVVRDPFVHGLFPVCVATHDAGIRLLFDLATVILLLDCRPGDRVLDLGAGSGFSSEMLARLGYDVVAADPDLIALGHNRRRPSHDPTRIDGTVRVVQAVAEGLPFADASFDGVVGMNVIHHVPDLPGAVSEISRVLRPGCRMVCSEPGLDHLEALHTRRAVQELGENDQAFDVIAFLCIARAHGFSHAMLSATLHPPLRLVPLEEIELFVSGTHPRSALTNAGVLAELHHRHPFAMIVREGVRPKTSRYPSVLSSRLHVEGLPTHARSGDTLTPMARVENTGDTVWLARPSPLGGYVTVGMKLLAADGRLVTDQLGRTCLTADVRPGGTAATTLSIPLPDDLAPGPYQLQFDLVDELICWFADLEGGRATIVDLVIS